MNGAAPNENFVPPSWSIPIRTGCFRSAADRVREGSEFVEVVVIAGIDRHPGQTPFEQGEQLNCGNSVPWSPRKKRSSTSVDQRASTGNRGSLRDFSRCYHARSVYPSPIEEASKVANRSSCADTELSLLAGTLGHLAALSVSSPGALTVNERHHSDAPPASVESAPRASREIQAALSLASTRTAKRASPPSRRCCAPSDTGCRCWRNWCGSFIRGPASPLRQHPRRPRAPG